MRTGSSVSFEDQIHAALDDATASLRRHLDADVRAIAEQVARVAAEEREAAVAAAAEAAAAEVRAQTEARIAHLRSLAQKHVEDLKHAAEAQIAELRQALRRYMQS